MLCLNTHGPILSMCGMCCSSRPLACCVASMKQCNTVVSCCNQHVLLAGAPSRGGDWRHARLSGRTIMALPASFFVCGERGELVCSDVTRVRNAAYSCCPQHVDAHWQLHVTWFLVSRKQQLLSELVKRLAPSLQTNHEGITFLVTCQQLQ